jgi:hypothetical protein
MAPIRLSALLAVLSLQACSDSSATSNAGGSPATGGAGAGTGGSPDCLPAAYALYTDAVSISCADGSITLSSTGVPDHPTPYFAESDPLWEEQEEGKVVNPGSLMEQDYVMTVPRDPSEAATKTATMLGPIGMAINGVAIYNDQEGGNQPVDVGVISSMDRGGGHSGPMGMYHYHFEPSFIADDDDTMIGHLRDGFPLYGRRDMDGEYPTDLDENGGHIGATNEYPEGIYHYHCSAVNYLDSGYYVAKSGSYFGEPGTFAF